MASLNTLRTKFGVVLSVVIALALLAFIFSLRTEMGFSGNDPKVGVIDGKSINYSEYYKLYEQIKETQNVQESNDQQSDMLANAVWQSLFSQYVMTPGFEDLGLAITEPERIAILNGQIPTQVFSAYFTDPATGQYRQDAVSDFLSQASRNPQAMNMWQQINEQARLEYLYQKYFGLIKGGVFANKLEVAEALKSNEKKSGRWVAKKFSSVPDSLINISNSDIQSYYTSHINQFKQLPNRTLKYVVFDVEPTDADMENLEKTVMGVGEEFAATDDVKTFVRKNRNGHISDTYYTNAQLSTEEAEALNAGKTYGPVLKNNEWTMSRVLDTKMAPDSLGIRHIVLSYEQKELADSLVAAIKKGANFAELAAQHSMAQTRATGGEVGVLPFSSFSGEFVAPLAEAKKGDVVTINSGSTIQIMQIYRADKPSKHIQVASITYPVVASEATRKNLHNQAGTFTVKAKDADSFNEAANEAAITPRVATLSQGERTLRGLEDSREVVRWAYGAEEGNVSEIFKVGNDYVVAILTEIDNEEYTPVEKVTAQIKMMLMRDKKFDYIKNQLSGSTLEEQAKSLGTTVENFKDVTLGAYYTEGIGMEPRVIGAIALDENKAVSAPVKGFTGLYVFQVDNVEKNGEKTAEGEQVRLQAVAEGMAQRFCVPAVQEMSEMQDLRGKYF